MPFTRYKKYLFFEGQDKDLNNNNIFNEIIPLGTKTNSLDYYTSNEQEWGYIPKNEIEKALRSPILHRYYKFYLLHEDESIAEDISDMVLDSGNIQKNNQTGQVRSLNITLINEKKKVLVGYENGNGVYEERYLWLPVPFKSKLWYYNKIKVVSCFIYEDNIYEVDEGIFVIFDPDIKNNSGKQTVSLQLYDKFALLDGTIDGKGDIEYEIPLKTPIWEAMKTLMKLPRNSLGQPYDYKEIIFPNEYRDFKTEYTIKKTGENAIGELMKEMGLSISCDVKYDTKGNLEISNSVSDIDYHNRQIAWRFEENEYLNPTIKINRSKIKNKITVKGANINGVLCSGVAENTNPKSSYNIYSEHGIKGQIIEDNLLASNFLCKERARYELKKYSQNYINITLQTIYIPHIEPGDLVVWSYPEWGIENELFIVNTVSLPLKTTNFMNLTMTNINELPI